jgi:hypothetical protein
LASQSRVLFSHATLAVAVDRIADPPLPRSAAIIAALASGVPIWAGGAGAIVAVIMLTLGRIWTKPSRADKPTGLRRIVHRGATKPDYDPWVGGGLG